MISIKKIHKLLFGAAFLVSTFAFTGLVNNALPLESTTTTLVIETHKTSSNAVYQIVKAKRSSLIGQNRYALFCQNCFLQQAQHFVTARYNTQRTVFIDAVKENALIYFPKTVAAREDEAKALS